MCEGPGSHDKKSTKPKDNWGFEKGRRVEGKRVSIGGKIGRGKREPTNRGGKDGDGNSPASQEDAKKSWGRGGQSGVTRRKRT